MDAAIPFPSTNYSNPATLLKKCPLFKPVPLIDFNNLAHACGVTNIHVKDERERLGLGSFKALGAAYVIATDAMSLTNEPDNKSLTATTYVTASAGNHGMSVAAGAAIFGANAVVYLSNSVPESFAARLREKHATVERSGQTYEESMQAALEASRKNGWKLLSDSSWPDYYEVPHRLMEGYLQSAHEVIEQINNPPSHIFLQAGVGGFAGAIAAYARKAWGDAPIIVIVEPAAAPALAESIKAGHPLVTSGPISCMGRLDCKEPSLIALKGLARDANYFLTIPDEIVTDFLPILEKHNLATTPSGAAGIAALFATRSRHQDLQLTAQSSVLTFLTEGLE